MLVHAALAQQYLQSPGNLTRGEAGGDHAGSLAQSLFGESASDANEFAILVARLFTGGKDVFSPHVSYHGLSSGSRSVTFAGGRRNHGPLASDSHAIPAPYCYRCPLAASFPSCDFACLGASFELIDAQSSAQTAAVITETLFSAGGVIDPPAGCWPGYARCAPIAAYC